jgi:hypothetical protein
MLESIRDRLGRAGSRIREWFAAVPSVLNRLLNWRTALIGLAVSALTGTTVPYLLALLAAYAVKVLVTQNVAKHQSMTAARNVNQERDADQRKGKEKAQTVEKSHERAQKLQRRAHIVLNEAEAKLASALQAARPEIANNTISPEHAKALHSQLSATKDRQVRQRIFMQAGIPKEDIHVFKKQLQMRALQVAMEDDKRRSITKTKGKAAPGLTL